MGEIDIIARKDGILRFIEVKYRSGIDYGDPLQAVSKAKQNKIRKAAQWYLMEKNIGNETACSFDVIAIRQNDIQYLFNSYGVM